MAVIVTSSRRHLNPTIRKLATKKVTFADLLGIVEQGGSLLQGRNLTCPGCERASDILDYIPLEYSEKYAEDIVVPLKCRACHHVFALKP